MFYLIYAFQGSGYIKKFDSLNELRKHASLRGLYEFFVVFYELPDGTLIHLNLNNN